MVCKYRLPCRNIVDKQHYVLFPQDSPISKGRISWDWNIDTLSE